MKPQGVVLFFTTSSALRAERVLLDANFTVKLIPTPREFSSDCGIACRFEWEECDRVRQTLDEAQVEIAAVKEMETA